LFFSGRARLDDGEVINNRLVSFSDTVHAMRGDIANGSETAKILFQENSQADTATLRMPRGSLIFFDSSKADDADIFVGGGGLSAVLFDNNSHANSANIRAQAGGVVAFNSRADADAATINLTGKDTTAAFIDRATADLAKITIGNKSIASFIQNSNPANATLNKKAGGLVDFASARGPSNNRKIKVGSIEGAGTFDLGPNELTVGATDKAAMVVTGLAKATAAHS
jgi:fibronectin-binding autotransporter adhesin